MPLYRKKPVVIEAMLVPAPDDLPAWGALTGWMMSHGVTDDVGVLYGPTGEGIVGVQIKTLEGTMRADLGDWVIRGVKGEFYPCKPDIFEATYEPVDPRLIDGSEAP